jgi:hypothetical protein
MPIRIKSRRFIISFESLTYLIKYRLDGAEKEGAKSSGPDFNCVYGKNNHGEHGAPRGKESEKSLLYLTYPRDPRVPVVVTVYAIANRSKV